MKYGEVQERLRSVGVLICKRGGLIRINHFGGQAETAIYTDSIDEALTAGMAMARPRHLPATWCSLRR